MLIHHSCNDGVHVRANTEQRMHLQWEDIMSKAEKIAALFAVIAFVVLAFKAFNEETPHPLEGDEFRICLNGQCYK